MTGHGRRHELWPAHESQAVYDQWRWWLCLQALMLPSTCSDMQVQVAGDPHAQTPGRAQRLPRRCPRSSAAHKPCNPYLLGSRAPFAQAGRGTRKICLSTCIRPMLSARARPAASQSWHQKRSTTTAAALARHSSLRQTAAMPLACCRCAPSGPNSTLGSKPLNRSRAPIATSTGSCVAKCSSVAALQGEGNGCRRHDGPHLWQGLACNGPFLGARSHGIDSCH